MLQSTWVHDSRPSRCIVFGPVEEILALVPTADITEAYADTGEILYRWRGRTKWVALRTEEVELPVVDAESEETEIEDPLVPPTSPVPPQGPGDGAVDETVPT